MCAIFGIFTFVTRAKLRELQSCNMFLSPLLKQLSSTKGVGLKKMFTFLKAVLKQYLHIDMKKELLVVVKASY